MNLQALFRAVFAAPADDTRKHVLADALQAAGDPRGDFIALQLRGSVIARRRSAKLLVRHREAFLGALGTVVVETVDERWEKGFLTECTVRLSGLTRDCPDWATVHTLHVFGSPELPAELASPRLSSLRTVLIYGSASFAELAQQLVAGVPNRTVRVSHVDAHEP